MTDVRVLNLRIHKNGTIFRLDDVTVRYWSNYINWSKTVIEYQDCVIPKWASFMQRELEKWFEDNIELVDKAYNYSEFHIKL